MNSREAVARGRQLQALIVDGGGPPPLYRRQFSDAVAALDEADLRGGSDGDLDGLGLFPFLLAAVASLMGIVVIVKTGTSLAKTGGKVIEEDGPSILRLLAWGTLALAGVAGYQAVRRASA